MSAFSQCTYSTVNACEIKQMSDWFFIFKRRTWRLVWSAPVCTWWNIYTFMKNTTTGHVQDIWLIILILAQRQRRAFIRLHWRHCTWTLWHAQKDMYASIYKNIPHNIEPSSSEWLSVWLQRRVLDCCCCCTFYIEWVQRWFGTKLNCERFPRVEAASLSAESRIPAVCFRKSGAAHFQVWSWGLLTHFTVQSHWARAVSWGRNT